MPPKKKKTSPAPIDPTISTDIAETLPAEESPFDLDLDEKLQELINQRVATLMDERIDELSTTKSPQKEKAAQEDEYGAPYNSMPVDPRWRPPSPEWTNVSVSDGRYEAWQRAPASHDPEKRNKVLTMIDTQYRQLTQPKEDGTPRPLPRRMFVNEGWRDLFQHVSEWGDGCKIFDTTDPKKCPQNDGPMFRFEVKPAEAAPVASGQSAPEPIYADANN